MTKEYFTNIYKEWIISENPTLLNLVFMLYGQPMMSVLYKNIKFNPNSSLYRLEKDEDNKEEFYTINKIDTAKSWNKLKQLTGSFYYTDVEGSNLIFFDDFFLDWDYGISLYCKDYNKIPDVFLNSLELFEEVPTIKVCSGITNAGIQLMESEIKKVIFEDIKENYNNDLPNDEIIDFIKNYPVIINESNLSNDFAKAVETILKRSLTEDELEKISDDECIDQILDNMLNEIVSYAHHYISQNSLK